MRARLSGRVGACHSLGSSQLPWDGGEPLALFSALRSGNTIK